MDKTHKDLLKQHNMLCLILSAVENQNNHLAEEVVANILFSHQVTPNYQQQMMVSLVLITTTEEQAKSSPLSLVSSLSHVKSIVCLPLTVKEAKDTCSPTVATVTTVTEPKISMDVWVLQL
jgi:hypothetical protein